MHHTKAQLIVGAGIGFLALLGIAVSFLRPNVVPLEERVNGYFAQEGETPQQRHTDVAQKIATLQALRNDSLFPSLPARHKEQIAERLQELQAYDEYAKRLAEISPPAAARSEEQLRNIESLLLALVVPPAYRAEWAQTESGQRQADWLADVQAIATAVADTRRGYLQLADAGKEVLRTVDAPELPRRAREVIERGKTLPTPDKDAKTPLPGSLRVRYAVVFEFASVKEAVKNWAKVREELQPLTLTNKP